MKISSMEQAHQDAKLMESSRSPERYPDLNCSHCSYRQVSLTAKHDTYHDISTSLSFYTCIIGHDMS